MTRSIENFGLHAVFADVLAGEFYPTSDPRTAHTLGRLSIATYQKGRQGETTRRSAWYRYGPSWAPQFSTSELVVNESEDTLAILSKLKIFNRNSPNVTLSVADVISNTEGERDLIIDGTVVNGKPQTLPLRLGKEIVEARNLVTELASKTFNEFR